MPTGKRGRPLKLDLIRHGSEGPAINQKYVNCNVSDTPWVWRSGDQSRVCESYRRRSVQRRRDETKVCVNHWLAAISWKINQREFSPFAQKMHFPFGAHVGGTAVFTWPPYVNQIEERNFHLMIGVLTSETFWIWSANLTCPESKVSATEMSKRPNRNLEYAFCVPTSARLWSANLTCSDQRSRRMDWLKGKTEI